MKVSLSSFDVLAVARELRQLEGARINKVFQVGKDALRIQISLPTVGRKDLLIEAGRGAYIAEHPAPAPRSPSTFAMTLRKHLGGAVVEGVSQVAFDRILEVKFRRAADSYYLIAELFGKGNIVLADGERRIVAILRVESYRDRELAPKKIYQYPPQRPDPMLASADDLQAAINSSTTDLVRALALDLGFGGLYAEEICLRSGLKKDKIGLTHDEAQALHRVVQELREALERDKPRTMMDDGEIVAVSPITLKLYEGKRQVEHDSFSVALEAYFSSTQKRALEEEVSKDYSEKLSKLRARLEEQEKALEKMREEEKNHRAMGDFIYSNLSQMQEILDAIAKARKKFSWDELASNIKEGREPLLSKVNRLLPKEGAVMMELDGRELRLDVRRSATENADQFYAKSKKAKAKTAGAEKARYETLKEMELLEREATAPSPEPIAAAEHREKKRQWYEKFRWFFSSDGFLVLGGRDAASNEVLVKRHMQAGDLFVHADIHGAPAVVIRAEGKEVSPSTIQEAFDFAAAYSKAWKHRVYGLDVYWVKPEQVSKRAEHGEYVAKGAFIIRGRKNFGKGKMEIAVGIKTDDMVEVFGGPTSAIEKQSNYFVKIIPGKKSSAEVAQEIKAKLLGKAREEDREKISAVALEEIQAFLPGGGSELVE